MNNVISRLSTRFVIWNSTLLTDQINDESLREALRSENKDSIKALHGLLLDTAPSTVADLCDAATRLQLGIALSGVWPPEHNSRVTGSEITKQPIEILNLSVRPMNCLCQAGIVTVEELASLSTSELLSMPNMGRLSIAEISEKLEAHNIQLDLRTPPSAIGIPNTAVDFEAMPVESMDLSVRSFNCLSNAGIKSIAELMRWNDSELLLLRNMGRKSLREIREKLEALRTSFEGLSRMETTSSSPKPPGHTLFPLAILLEIADCGLPEHISGPLIAEGIETVYSLVKCSFLQLRDLFDGNPANARALQLWLHSLGLRPGMSLAECLDSHFDEVADAFADDTKNLALQVSGESKNKEPAGSAEPRVGQPATCLDDEIEKILAATRSEKNKSVVRLFLGWDGGAGTTLEKAGHAFQITRERVRQIAIRVLTNARPFSTVFAEKAIAFVASLAPVLADDAESALISAGIVKTPFRLESLAATARAFGLDVPWRVQLVDGQRTVWQADVELKSKFHGFLSEAHRRISHYGTTTKSKVRAICPPDTSIEALNAFCDGLEDLHWLDDEREWFWMPTSRNAVLSRLAKVLRVVPALTIEQAHEAVLRDRRMNDILLPIPVFRQLCEIQTWCRINDGKVEATEDLPEAEEYESAEFVLVDLLRRHGPVMRTHELHVLAEERGVGEVNFGSLLCGSNLLVQHGRGVVGLVGSDMEQLRQKELVFALDVVDAAESQHTSEGLGESYESVLDGCEPTSLSFHREVARAVIRASTRLRKGGAWSLAELAFSPKDLGTLETWSNSGLPPPSQIATTGFMSSEMGVDEQESIALLFLLFCFQVTRNHGTEGEIWPLVERTLNPTLRTYFFHVRSVPKVRSREATERVCAKLRVRNLFGREGEYSWLRTVFLQFGITRRGLQRLPAWLGQLAALPVAVEDLLNSETLRSESFGDFWRTLQRYRAGQLSRATAARVLGVNPWVDQQDLALILDVTVVRNSQQHDDWEAKRTGIEDSENLFGPPIFCWDGPAPQFQIALNSRSRWLTEARYAITVSPSKQRLSVVRTDQDYRIDSQDGLLHVDLSASTVEVDLLFRQKSSLAEPIKVCLLPQGCEYIFYDLRTGRALPIGEGNVRPNHPYALLARTQLDITHESPELRRVFGGEWAVRAYRNGLPADLLIKQGEVIVWERLQAEATSKEDPIPSIEATCSGGHWGEKSLLTIRLKIAEVTPEFLIFGEQRLELKQSNNDRYSCWLTLMPDVDYENTRARVECRYRNRLRWLTVKVKFGPIEGTAIETEGGWKPLRADENLDSEYLRQHRIYTKIPGVFDGDRVAPAEWVWLEGAHFCGRPRNTPSLFGETAYAVGESLWLSVGPYNRPRLGEKLAASIINSGVVKTVEFRSGMWELQFRQSIELDPDYQLWIWENDVPQPRPLSKSEWLYDEGLCVIESQGEYTPLSFAVSYQGHWLGAKSTCPGWQGYEKLISESVDWPSTARWLKWWRVPVLHEDLKAPISRAVTKAPLESLQSWLLRGQLTEIARFSEEFEDAWLSVCRQVLWEWRPCRNEAAQLLRGLGADGGAADVQWDGIWDDLGQLLNINPLLFVRLCSEGLAVLCPDANAEDRLRMRRKLRNRILGLRLYFSEPEVSEALMNAHSEAAKAMAVDDRFVSRSLLVDAISLYSGKLHQHHNLRIAISNSQAVRTYLAATILQKVIDGEL